YPAGLLHPLSLAINSSSPPLTRESCTRLPINAPTARRLGEGKHPRNRLRAITKNWAARRPQRRLQTAGESSPISAPAACSVTIWPEKNGSSGFRCEARDFWGFPCCGVLASVSVGGRDAPGFGHRFAGLNHWVSLPWLRLPSIDIDLPPDVTITAYHRV